MAAGTDKLLAEMTERLLVCEICQEDYQIPHRLPRVLPCHHTFCGECLQKLSKDSHLICPMCRRSIPVEDSFPAETTRMALLDLKKEMRSQVGPGCQGCSDGARACGRCQECGELLCEECCRSHRKVNATRHHHIESLTEAAMDPGELGQQAEMCGKHRDKLLELYCCDCRQATCSSCHLHLHKGHTMRELGPVLQEKKTEIMSLCGRIEAALPRFQERVTSSGTALDRLDTGAHDTEATIRSLCSGIVAKVKTRQAHLLTDLYAKVEADRPILKGQVASDQTLLNEAKATLQFGKRLVSLGQPSQLLSGPQEMVKACDSLESRGTASGISVPVYQADTNKMAELIAVLDEVGEIRRHSPDIKRLCVYAGFLYDGSKCNLQCTVDGSGRVLTNDPSPKSLFTSISNRCGFQGTCCTEPLPQESCFWQVRCVIQAKPKVIPGFKCEVGVVEQDAVHVVRDTWCLPETALSFHVMLKTDNSQVAAIVSRGDHCLTTQTLGPVFLDRPVDVTLGFLLDRCTGHLRVIEVSQSRVLASSRLTLTKPLWAVAAVKSKKKAGAVRVELQTGESLSIPGGLNDLIKSLLQNEG